MTTIAHDMPSPVILGGVPWWDLRGVLKATGHRPLFIRNSRLSLAGLRRFLQRSDKPEAPGLLAQIESRYSPD